MVMPPTINAVRMTVPTFSLREAMDLWSSRDIPRAVLRRLANMDEGVKRKLEKKVYAGERLTRQTARRCTPAMIWPGWDGWLITCAPTRTATG
jgi:hypothetical protein